jgi:hypothetical protein
MIGLVMGISLLKPFFLLKKNLCLITTNLCLVIDGFFWMDEKSKLCMKWLPFG